MGMLEELAPFLQAAGAGTMGTDLFLGDLPDTPDTAVALFETAGQEPLYIHEQTTPAIERPGLQLLSRCRQYTVGRSRIETAYRALVAVTNLTIAGTRYLSIRAVSTPALTGRDEQHRPEFSCNLRVERVPPD